MFLILPNNEKLINSCIESYKCISKLTINKLRTLCRDNPDKFMTIMNKVLGCKTSINKKRNYSDSNPSTHKKNNNSANLDFDFNELRTGYFCLCDDLAEGGGQDFTPFNIFQITDKLNALEFKYKEL